MIVTLNPWMKQTQIPFSLPQRQKQFVSIIDSAHCIWPIRANRRLVYPCWNGDLEGIPCGKRHPIRRIDKSDCTRMDRGNTRDPHYIRTCPLGNRWRAWVVMVGRCQWSVRMTGYPCRTVGKPETDKASLSASTRWRETCFHPSDGVKLLKNLAYFWPRFPQNIQNEFKHFQGYWGLLFNNFKSTFNSI